MSCSGHQKLNDTLQGAPLVNRKSEASLVYTACGKACWVRARHLGKRGDPAEWVDEEKLLMQKCR